MKRSRLDACSFFYADEAGGKWCRKMVPCSKSVQKGVKCVGKTRDWGKIASEYITTDISLTQLSEKHDIPLRTVKDRCAKEGWVEKREEHCTKRVQSLSRQAIKNEQRRLDRLQDAAEGLADLVNDEIIAFRKRINARDAVDAYINEDDMKILKGLTSTLQGVADAMRQVYAIPTIKEGIDLERWEKEKQGGAGAAVSDPEPGAPAALAAGGGC